MTDMSPRKQRLIAFIRAVWDQGDVSAIPEHLAPAYTIHHDPGDPWERRTLDQAGFTERVVASRAAFPDQKFAIQGLFENEEGVVLTWLWQGTHAGDLPGFPASGRCMTMSGATAYYFDAEDRLTGHWQVADRLAIFRQLQEANAAH